MNPVTDQELRSATGSGSELTQERKEKACRSVLVVDDNTGVRDALIAKITAAGISAHGARSGDDALRLLPGLASPTLIFLDLMMPKLNGWELIEIWKKNPSLSQNQIVLISAVNQKSRPDKNPISNIAGSILKPLSLRAVMNYVDRFCVPLTPSGHLRPASEQSMEAKL